MTLGYWLTHPRLAWARFRYYLWERSNPDKPWMCPGTIQFCQTHLSKTVRALEFGSGRSTRWFSELVGQLVSIEHNPDWYQIVNRQLANSGIQNVDYRLIPLNHPVSAAEQPEYDPIPDYVAIIDEFDDASLGLAIVDGHYRTHCVGHLISKMASGGYLLVDDVNRWRSLNELPIPPGWRVVDDSSNGVKRCVIWQSPIDGREIVGA